MPIHKKKTWIPSKVMEDGRPDGLFHQRLGCLNEPCDIDGVNKVIRLDGPVKGISARSRPVICEGRNNGAVRFETFRATRADGESVAVEDWVVPPSRDYAAALFGGSGFTEFIFRTLIARFHRCTFFMDVLTPLLGCSVCLSDQEPKVI